VILSKNEHLSKEDIIKNGSIYTPKHIVQISKSWLKDKINIGDYIIDFGVGYGAFISEFLDLSANLIGTDLDIDSVNLVKSLFPKVKVIAENSLLNISRKKYGISKEADIVIIGNPPYNDFTSQYKKGKKGELTMDDSVKARDLGISFMKMYALLNPTYICILHPLSYLIKKTNFNLLKEFKDKYVLEKGIIFSSNEFESIKKSHSEFPVVLALYKKTSSVEMTFDFIRNFEFEILNSSSSFSLKNYETIDGKISKYPRKECRSRDGLKFYTLRDINALRRNKTFLIGNLSNGLSVALEDLYKYAWLDYFKKHFSSDKMFLYGNLSPLYSSKIEIAEVKKELISYVFQTNDIVKNYIIKNNLMGELKKFYRIEEFSKDYKALDEIMHTLI